MKLVCLVITAAAAVFAGCVRPSDVPLLITSEGRAVSTENCERSSGQNQVTCRGYFCEIALHKQNVLPAYASSRHSRHLHNFSDQPLRSVHMAKYEGSEKTIYAKCEMEGDAVTVVSQISEQDYEQK